MSTAGVRRESPYGVELVEHDGFFYERIILEAVMDMHSQFKAREDGVYVCSGFKTGTTWLRSMFNAATTSPVSKEAFFDSFCSGASISGPFAEHVLSFCNASRKQSNILFLAYEDMKADNSLSHVTKISDFLGQSSLTEEDTRCIDSQCSFQSLSALDVNKNGLVNFKNSHLSNQHFFRKGEVGDWKNHFTTPEMNSRMDLAVESKFRDAGLFVMYEL